MAMTLRDLLEQSKSKFAGTRADIAQQSVSPDFASIVDLIKKGATVPGLDETLLPVLLNILAPGGDVSGPYEEAIRRAGEQNVAAAQTDALKRGLTGSSIEAGNMGQARAATQFNLGQHYAKTASGLADYITEIMGKEGSRLSGVYENLSALAGQEMTALRDIDLFNKQLGDLGHQAQQNRKSALLGSGIRAGGGILETLFRGG